MNVTTAHNILKHAGMNVNEQGAIKWLARHGVEVKQTKVDIKKLYSLIHERIGNMPVYSPQSDYEYDVLYELLEKANIPVNTLLDGIEISDAMKDLRVDDNFIYYVNSYHSYHNELPEHMGTETFLEIDSYATLISLEDLQAKVATLEE